MSKELMFIPKYGDFNEVVKRMGVGPIQIIRIRLWTKVAKIGFASFFIYYIFYEKFITKNIYNLYKT